MRKYLFHKKEVVYPDGNNKIVVCYPIFDDGYKAPPHIYCIKSIQDNMDIKAAINLRDELNRAIEEYYKDIYDDDYEEAMRLKKILP